VVETNENDDGVYLELVDYVEMYGAQSVPPVCINDIDARTVQAKQFLSNLIRTEYDGDQVSVLPSCGCGHTTGQYAASIKLRCELCGTVPMSILERPIESTLWIRAPRGVKALINPTIWYILDQLFKKNGISIMRWLCDPYYRIPSGHSAFGEQLEAYGFQRGLNNFFDHFDLYLSILVDNRLYSGSPDRKDNVMELVRENRDLVFTPYLPIPNKIAFITEKTAVGTYADFGMVDAIDAAYTILDLGEAYQNVRLKKAESRATVCVVQLSAYYNNLYKNILGGKKGWFRKHIFGTRANYSFRNVVNSLTGWHLYSELEIPWTTAIAVLQAQLTNKLLKRGWGPNQIEKFLSENAHTYNPELDALFDELISDSPYVVGVYNPIGTQPHEHREIRGIPCIFHRN
jgi:hypothetical protein